MQTEASPPSSGAPGVMADAPSYPIRSVDNTLQILLELQGHSAVRVSDIAERLGVSRSTAHRMLAALVYRGFAVRHPETRRYHAGPVLWELGMAAANTADLGEAAEPHLEALSEDTGHAAHLMVLEGSDSRFVAGHGSPEIGPRVGVILPAHASSGGKLLLAHLRASNLKALFQHPPQQLTKRTITSLSRFNAELARIRSRGFATNLGESEEGIFALAVGVWGPPAQPVAAMAVATPLSQASKAEAGDILTSLRRAAADLSDELGGVPTDSRQRRRPS